MSLYLAEKHLPQLIALVGDLQSMPAEDILAVMAVFAVTYIITGLILKFLFLQVLRALGLYSPRLYKALPSVLPGWRSVFLLKMAFARWREIVFRFGKQHTAGFSSTLSTMTVEYNNGSQIVLGRVWFAGFGLVNPVGISIKTHLMIYAASGAGKSVYALTLMSLYQGSLIIIDPKGEQTEKRAPYDKREWVQLHPHNPEKSDQWNPLDDIKAAMQREGQDAAVKWCQRLANSLIITLADSKSPFFTDTCKSYVTALLLHMLSAYEDKFHTLPFMHEIACHGLRVFNEDGSLETTPEEAVALLNNQLLNNTAFDGAVAASASAFINASGDTKSSLIATLQQQLQWLAAPSVKYMLSATTKSLSEAKTRNDVAFSFIAPVLSLREELKPLFRLFTNFVNYTFESVPKKSGQTLFVIDEVQAMGYNETLETALPVARSYGLSIVAIAQDREGMKAAYPKTYGSFEGNADAVLFMGTNHPDNYNYVSEALGKKTHVQKDPRTGKKTYRESLVMTPDQVKRFLSPDTGNLIVIRAGARAMRLKLAPYFKELPVTAFGLDSGHREPILRFLSRLIFNPKSIFRHRGKGERLNS